MIFDLPVTLQVGFLFAVNDNGVSTVVIGSDAMGGIVDDPIAEGGGRFEPPANIQR